MGHGSKQDKPSPGLQDIGGKKSLQVEFFPWVYHRRGMNPTQPILSWQLRGILIVIICCLNNHGISWNLHVITLVYPIFR
jgi:hypothetical protein